jgi:hypothetical protein
MPPLEGAEGPRVRRWSTPTLRLLFTRFSGSLPFHRQMGEELEQPPRNSVGAVREWRPESEDYRLRSTDCPFDFGFSSSRRNAYTSPVSV